MSEGIILNESQVFLTDQVMAVALVTALVVGAIVYLAAARPRALFGSRRTGGSTGRKLGLFLGILCAVAVLVFPILLCIQDGNALAAVPLLGVRLMQAIVLDNGYVDYIEGLPSGILATVYYMLIGLAYVALPILAALNVYDLVMQNLSRAGAMYAVRVISRGKNVYLFSDFNRNTYGLAHDVLKRDERAFVIFSAMSKLERDTWSTEIGRLGTDRVRCYESDYPDMAARLCNAFKFSQLKCFAISDSCERDVSETCRTLGMLRGTWSDARGRLCDAFEGRHGGDRIARVRLYVTCDSVDDQVLLDAANGRGESIGTVPPLRLTVLNEATMAAYALMEQAPLFMVLDQGPVGPIGLRPSGPTELAVLVIGSGRYAEEALKTALWYGQMYNVALRIDVAATDADIMADRVYQRYPALGHNDRFVLQFTKVNVQSPSFDADFLARHAGSQHLYIIVAIDDDSLSYEVAMHARLFFLDRQMNQWQDVSTHPLIACLMRDEVTSELVAARFDEDVPGYGLVPFGCGSKLFGYDNVIDSRLEREGQLASDLYDALCAGVSDEAFSREFIDVARLRDEVAMRLERLDVWAADYDRVPADGGISCLTQIRHYSNLALALHARYKAWAFGLGDEKTCSPVEAAYRVRQVPIGAGRQLGKIEHDRWAVFYQTHGFTHLSSGDQERYSRLLAGKNNRRKIESLKKHAFVCGNDEIWPNYLHAVGGFSYDERSDCASGGGCVAIAAKAARGSAEGVRLQLLDGDYRVVDEWTVSSNPHLCSGLADGIHVVHPASAMPGFECADDLMFEIRLTSPFVDGRPVDVVECDVQGKQLVNPVVYDWAFAFASVCFPAR